jgi:hypothetical protein
VSADFFTALNECTKLISISFLSAEFDGPYKEMPPITNLKNLRKFEMAICKLPMLKIIPLTIFLDTLPHLVFLAITNTSGTIDDLMNKIIMKCPALKSLDLDGNHRLRCRALRNISTCKMLNYLDISECWKLRAKAIKHVADGCPNLQYLNVSGIPMTGSVFRQVLRCRNLKTLSMSVFHLTGIDLELIAKKIPRLQKFNIATEFDYKLPHNLICELQRRIPHLSITMSSPT